MLHIPYELAHLKKHQKKRNSPERKAELNYRRHRLRQDTATIFEYVKSKYIPAGEHRNVPKGNR